ncbi:MAG: type II toxin-antitoxin system YafQ family toxin [Bacteroidetes bacterium]|nr:type II toxin-antitoxin system YafQ family toxin [Bacteroidota bacterium]
MFSLQYTTAFTQDVKRVKKRAYNTRLLLKALVSLEADGIVTSNCKPHKLSGSYSDCWECHLKADWLLIWRKNEEHNSIELIRTGTHADLF